MDTVAPPRPRRATNADQKTAAFHLDSVSLDAVQRLVDRGVFPNKSAAVDAALRLLRTYHADDLRDETTAP